MSHPEFSGILCHILAFLGVILVQNTQIFVDIDRTDSTKIRDAMYLNRKIRDVSCLLPERRKNTNPSRLLCHQNQRSRTSGFRMQRLAKAFHG